jgi:hypothetical protein
MTRAPEGHQCGPWCACDVHLCAECEAVEVARKGDICEACAEASMDADRRLEAQRDEE